MRPRRQYRILQAAFVFALVGVAFFGSFQGMHSGGPAEHAAPPPAHSGGPHIVKEPEALFEKFLDPVAIFTGVLALVTYLMARAISEQVRLARDEFNATHRPEIIVHSFEVARAEVDDGHSLAALFVVVNKGAVGGTIVDISGRIFLTQVLRPGEILTPLGHAGRYLAGGESFRDVSIIGTALETAITDMNSGYARKLAPEDARMWCIGRIIYQDRDGRRRETGFCRSYDVIGERWVKVPESDYEYAY